MSVGPPDGTATGRNLTPLMARLDPSDVEILDALIAAGIVSDRADGVRGRRCGVAGVRPGPAAMCLAARVKVRGSSGRLRAGFRRAVGRLG
jgi:hypothetical protein